MQTLSQKFALAQANHRPDKLRQENEELRAALRQCLIFVDMHRRQSGGDGDLTAAYVRSLLAESQS